MERGAPIPASILHREQALEELLEIMTDLVAVRAMDPAPPAFTVSGSRLVSSNFAFVSPVPAFRSGPAVVHSNVIPLDEDFLVVELASQERGFRLTLESGQKKDAPLSISLYRGDNLQESLLIKGRVQKDLNSLKPGAYSLVSGETRLLSFSILDENKDHHAGRSNHSQN